MQVEHGDGALGRSAAEPALRRDPEPRRCCGGGSGTAARALHSVFVVREAEVQLVSCGSSTPASGAK
ncbi:hypothetical protein ACPPVW_14615 [Leifsonia sp. McL0607]|uniref:hypothetical protein n=1 Tax=Leifsonia sp. McL0607 TaxID=3415672 RepID=UPI003CE9C642